MNLAEQFRSEVVTVEPHETLQKAVRRMKEANVGAVVVVKDRQVVGIVTDRDAALAAVLDERGPATPVSQVMTKNVVTIWDDQGLFNATQYFLGHEIRRLPIVNRDNELVGMVTIDDVLVLLARELFNISKAVAPSLADKQGD